MTEDLNTLQRFLEEQALLNGPIAMDPMMQHLLLRKADTPLLSTDFFTTTYGNKVWSTLNDQTRFWNLLRKVPWGPRTGWRNRSGRIGSTGSVSETGTLPDAGKSTFQQLYSDPRSVVTPFGVTAKAQFMSGLEGGIGDALAEEQENAKIDHVKWINQSLVLHSHAVVTTAGASGTAVLKPAGAFKPGDTIYGTHDGGAEQLLVVTHNASTGVLTWTNTDGTADANNMVDGNDWVVYSRRGPTSLDDIIEADGRNRPGANSGNPKCYNLTTRTAAGYAAGQINDNNGTLRGFATSQLDSVIRKIRTAGGEPDLIVTNLDGQDLLASALASKQQFMGTGEFKVKFGDEVTLPGMQTGFVVSTYKGIPVFGDVDFPFDYAEDGAAKGPRFYVLDTRYLEIAVATMTQYLESRNYILNGSLSIKGLFWTMFELRCSDITKQGKLVDQDGTLAA